MPANKGRAARLSNKRRFRDRRSALYDNHQELVHDAPIVASNLRDENQRALRGKIVPQQPRLKHSEILILPLWQNVLL
jgi:hypothetical protein